MSIYFLIVDDRSDAYGNEWPNNIPDGLEFYHITGSIQENINQGSYSSMDCMVDEIIKSKSTKANWKDKDKDQEAYPIGSGTIPTYMYAIPTKIIEKELSIDSETRFLVFLDLKFNTSLKEKDIELFIKELSDSGCDETNIREIFNKPGNSQYLPSVTFLKKHENEIQDSKICVVITSNNWRDYEEQGVMDKDNLSGDIRTLISNIIGNDIQFMLPNNSLYANRYQNINIFYQNCLNKRKNNLFPLDWADWRKLKRIENNEMPSTGFHPHHLPGGGSDNKDQIVDYHVELYGKLTDDQKKLLCAYNFETADCLLTDNNINSRNLKWKPTARSLLQVDFVDNESPDKWNEVHDLTWVIASWNSKISEITNNNIFLTWSVPPQCDFLWFNCNCFLEALEHLIKGGGTNLKFSLSFEHIDHIVGDISTPMGLMVTLKETPVDPFELLNDVSKNPCGRDGKNRHRTEACFNPMFPLSKNKLLSKSISYILNKFAFSGVSWIVHSGYNYFNDYPNFLKNTRSCIIMLSTDNAEKQFHAENTKIPWKVMDVMELPSNCILNGLFHFFVPIETFPDPYKQVETTPHFRIADPTNQETQKNTLKYFGIELS